MENTRLLIQTCLLIVVVVILIETWQKLYRYLVFLRVTRVQTYLSFS